MSLLQQFSAWPNATLLLPADLTWRGVEAGHNMQLTYGFEADSDSPHTCAYQSHVVRERTEVDPSWVFVGMVRNLLLGTFYYVYMERVGGPVDAT